MSAWKRMESREKILKGKAENDKRKTVKQEEPFWKIANAKKKRSGGLKN